MFRTRFRRIVTAIRASFGATDKVLMETSDKLLQEDGTSFILCEGFI